MTDTTTQRVTEATRDELEQPDACTGVDPAGGGAHPNRPAHVEVDDLTAQERRIARRLLRGDGPKQIACVLRISARTVYWHVENVYRKTGSHSLGEFFAWAYRHRDCCDFTELLEGRR